MSVYFPEIEEIYFSKTREYFQEVVSSYSIGNYRSATVMLYSVAVCDILFKLQELKDMYNDTVADEILREVEKSRSSHDNKSKSKWEKEFIDNVYVKTKLLDLEAYTNLNHLYDHRNFSAHPALNENYELIAPSKETTVANIKNVLNDILIKPPIFIKNVTNTLTEDLQEKKHIYSHEYDKLSIYLNNKYFSKMNQAMKLTVAKAFWKFSFCLPNDDDCQKNMVINRRALKILVGTFENDMLNYVRDNQRLFSVASDDKCILNLCIFLSKYPAFYKELDEDARLQIDSFIEKETKAKAIAWFKYTTPKEHFAYLNSVWYLCLDEKAIRRIRRHYLDVGEQKQMVDFFIEYYASSSNYNRADSIFEDAIEPLLEYMNYDQFVRLITVSNENRQIYARNASVWANGKIVSVAKEVLGAEFDYTQFSNFKFDHAIIESSEKISEKNENNDDWEF